MIEFLQIETDYDSLASQQITDTVLRRWPSCCPTCTLYNL